MNSIMQRTLHRFLPLGFKGFLGINGRLSLVRDTSTPGLFVRFEVTDAGSAEPDACMIFGAISVVEDPFFQLRGLFERGADLSSLHRPPLSRRVRLREPEIQSWLDDAVRQVPTILRLFRERESGTLLERTADARRQGEGLADWYKRRSRAANAVLPEPHGLIDAWEASGFVMPLHDEAAAEVVRTLLRGALTTELFPATPRLSFEQVKTIRVAADRVFAGSRAIAGP